ncbi:dicer-2 protein [Radiomyces spectabilis]|uniref:dicer-2 protein n=1 Tax=Radiomyces spectabilis TaxID=64574 RepID=UPI00221EEFE4|nr:dicer-2 protein [Radiomyces spectabilis]KAI8384572.1 dicer-2 protein [Radiomyces spectabilis]
MVGDAAAVVECNEQDKDRTSLPIIPIPNKMNEGDRDRLLKYLDPEFFEAKPDAKTKSTYQLEMEVKEKLDLDELEEPEEMVDDQAAVKQYLQPKEYQYELFKKAQNENIIAVLDTGSGKTLIAVMLIQHMARLERDQRLVRRKAKMTFFLVDRVPLVFQQASVISANCDVVVKHVCGQMDVDSWTEKTWRLLFEESDVFVMTAQIFLDTLRHGFVSLDEVNLIIFDECHHATRRHPYNLIMREFYDCCPVEGRPKIFGMTASPMHSKTDVQYSATHLEHNLDCRIYTATNLESLNSLVQKPKEIVIAYHPSPGYDLTPTLRTLYEKLKSEELYNRCFVIAGSSLDHLGPWCTERLWRDMLQSIRKKFTNEGKKRTLETENLLNAAYDISLKGAPDNPNLSDFNLFSPKVIKLMKVLSIYTRMEDFRGIVFVERRHTAIALCALIQASESLSSLKCAVLTGHGTKDEGDFQMKFHEQNRIIRQFRDGDTNLLIATNVAEEGLDIQPCNVVIRFDFFTTLINYIQSRGRARRRDSKYIILTESNNMSQLGMIDEFRRLEEDMRIFCQTLPAERNMASKFLYGNDEGDEEADGMYDSDDSDDDMLEECYLVLSTGAKITKQSAVPLIHRYCASLPSDAFCIPQPLFEVFANGGGYCCTLYLPNSAPIREVTSKVARSKIQAKRLAALAACTQLHSYKALTDHLLPAFQKSNYLGEMAPQVDENGLIIGSRRRRNYYPKNSPKFWEKEEEEEEEEVHETEQGHVEGHDQAPIAVQDKENEPPQQKDTISESPTAEDASQKTVDIITEAVDTMTEPLVAENAQDATDEEQEEPFEIPTLYLSTIEVRLSHEKLNGVHVRRMALFTKKPFPSLPGIELYGHGETFMAAVHPLDFTFTLDEEKIQLLAQFLLTMCTTVTNKQFTCPLDEFPYFVAPLVFKCHEPLPVLDSVDTCMNVIDWAEMERATAAAFVPFDLSAPNCFEDVILIDYADNQRRYYIKEVCHDMHPHSPPPSDMEIRETGFESFAAFYEQSYSLKLTQPEQPMVRVSRVRKMMNYLTKLPHQEPKEKKSTATFVIPEFCKTFTMTASVLQAALLFPAIMTRIDSLLLCFEARNRFKIPATDTLMLEAYTAPSANMSMDYERLETLGDSLLKFIATIRLYINFPFSNEGELHCLRIRVICNRALYRAAKRLKIARYVSTQAFNRRYWRPHHFIASTDTEESLKETRQHMLSDKTLADIVEASLGAAYLSEGLDGGLRCAIQMQVPFDEITCWDDFMPYYLVNRDKVPERAGAKALSELDVPRLEGICGYQFNRPLLAVEALTHASLPNSNSTVPCYQRLEFLGDAILDFLVIRYLFEKYPSASPGLITDLKGSCVNNRVLGIICLECNLHRHIIHYSNALIRAIQETYEEVQQMKEDGTAVGEYWTDMNIPKVLSDVVESMIGAIFVDAGFNLAPIEKLFDKWFLNFFDTHVTPELIRVHPFQRLTRTLQQAGCEGFMFRNHTSTGTDENSQKCVIFLHDKPLACGSSDNLKEARKKAAEKANLRLEEEPDLFDLYCNCNEVRAQRAEARLRQREEAGSDDEVEIIYNT